MPQKGRSKAGKGFYSQLYLHYTLDFQGGPIGGIDVAQWFNISIGIIYKSIRIYKYYFLYIFSCLKTFYNIE